MSYTKADWFGLLNELHDLYYTGDLGAQRVYHHNKCCTINEIADDTQGDIRYNMERTLKRIDRMIEMGDERDVKKLTKLLEIFYELIGFDTSIFKYRKLIPSKTKILNRQIREEFQRFNSFKENQNTFDNILSLIKIIDRLNHNSNNIEFRINQPVSENFDVEKCLRDIYDQSSNDFKAIRFLI